MLAEAGLGPDRLVERLPHRRRGKPDPLDPGAPPRRAGADRPHPHRRGARPAARLRHPGGRDLGDRRRAGRHGGRLFQPRGGARDDRGADPLRLPAHRLRQRPDARTTSARATAPRAIWRRWRRPGCAAPPIHVVHDEAAIRPETGARALRALRAATPDVDAVFFTSDVFAVGAILACRELGIGVPDADGHRRLPRPRGRPRRLADAHHGARAGHGDGSQGRPHDPRPPRRQAAAAAAGTTSASASSRAKHTARP